MKLEVTGIAPGARIPDTFTFARLPREGESGPVQLSENRNPRIAWSELPEGTRSIALICVDTDVPSQGDDVNQEGRTVPRDLPRVDFYHWVMVDVDPSLGEIPEGVDSDRVTPRGKGLGRTELGLRGRNDYTSWFAGDPEMEGIYAGYDGPGPPWNDERLHHYRFRLYALNVESLGLDGNFGGKDVERAIEGHVLASAEHVGTFSLKPGVG